MRAELERLCRWVRDEQHTFRRNPDVAATYRGVGYRIKTILAASDWIPVNERLPETVACVWATWARDDGDSFVGMAYVDEDGSWFCWDTDDEMDTPLAWQPIEEPAPYRAEGGE